VVRALDDHLAGRTTGPLFITKTGGRLDQPEAWRMVRHLARRASLDGAAEIRPHSRRVAFITALARLACRWRMCRMRLAMLTRGQRDGMTAVDILLIGMRLMW
jgi:site-specific recombinase XerD